MAEERLLWEDLTEGDVAVSSGRTIPETDVVSFCGLSGGFNWFPVDAVAAKESVFGQRVALFGSVGSRTPSTARRFHISLRPPVNASKMKAPRMIPCTKAIASR